MTKPCIAIDGPSGAGKSTLARALARELGLAYVDTGAMYRAVAWAALRRGADTAEKVAALLEDLDLRLATDPDGFRVTVDGEDVTGQLRDPEVGQMASEVAQLEPVRVWLVMRQRQIAADGAVVEGRDIGTVVLPDAAVKLFVTAPEEVRMRRRAAQLGTALDGRVTADIRDRDRRDRQRAASPLRPAADAIEVDTGAESPQESLRRIVDLVRRRVGAGS